MIDAKSPPVESILTHRSVSTSYGKRKIISINLEDSHKENLNKFFDKLCSPSNKKSTIGNDWFLNFRKFD